MSIQQMLVGAVSGPSEFTLSISPSFIDIPERQNGLQYNSSVTANANSGVGPFTYSWTWQSGGLGITLSNTTSASCSITTNGTNQLRQGVLHVVVTDTGDGNKQKQGTCEISIQFGIPV